MSANIIRLDDFRHRPVGQPSEPTNESVLFLLRSLI